MSAPTNHWKLGLFVVLGFFMMLSTVAWLGARSLRKEVGRYVSYFDESVQGLEVGSPIKFRGVTIGSVAKIDIANDHRHVEVFSDLGKAELTRLGLDVVIGPVDPKKPLKFEQGLGLRVQLASSGLTGVKFLQLDFFPVAENPEPFLPFDVPSYYNYIPAAPSTIKSVEDSMVRVVQRLPEVLDQMTGVLGKIDFILSGLKDKDLPERITAVLDNANTVLGQAQKTISGLDTTKLSKDASSTMKLLSETVTRMNTLLASVTGDKGLLASVTRASNTVGDTMHDIGGNSRQLEDTLRAVEKAATSIGKLAAALEKDPDMLLKGKGRGVEANR
jgi:phospholipid/cholesterol/gamma-HCH transport system substrate-binding protein